MLIELNPMGPIFLCLAPCLCQFPQQRIIESEMLFGPRIYVNIYKQVLISLIRHTFLTPLQVSFFQMPFNSIQIDYSHHIHAVHVTHMTEFIKKSFFACPCIFCPKSLRCFTLVVEMTSVYFTQCQCKWQTMELWSQRTFYIIKQNIVHRNVICNMFATVISGESSKHTKLCGLTLLMYPLVE